MLGARVLFGAMLVVNIASAVLGREMDQGIVKKYLVVPDAKAIEDSWFNWPTIRKAIDAVCADGGTKNFETILARSRELSTAELKDNPLSLKSEVYRMLVDVSQTNDENCDPELAQFWIRVYALLKLDKAEDKQKLMEYLLHYGESKFSECAYRAQDVYYDRQANYRYYSSQIYNNIKGIDEFIADMYKSSGDSIDAKLYGAAVQFDWNQVLADPTLKQKLFVKIWRTNRARLSYDKEGKHFGPANRFVEYTCDLINRIGGKSLETLNLGLALSSFKISNSHLRRLNEYNRIFCVEAQEPETWNKLAKITFRRKNLLPEIKPQPDHSWNEKQLEIYWPNFSQDFVLHQPTEINRDCY